LRFTLQTKGWYKNIFNWFLIILVLINALPILAPLFMELGFEGLSKVIYFVFSFTCHQFHHRSFHLFDYQYAWCVRDVAIWVGILLIALLVRFRFVKGIKWYWVLPFVIPIAMDGGIQTIFTVLEVDPFGINTGEPLYISNNFSRFITGFIFGMGVSLWISPTLYQESNFSKKLEEVSINQTNILLLVIFIGIFYYIGLVGLWQITSDEYEPGGYFDSIVRTPRNDFFIRRQNAVCPTEEGEMFEIDCFF
jgi:uncharacterized membrane protein